ncbi:ABC-2 type transport system permease protein [Haloechinothrix alba]|uniref:ABC-2 type transport system permease protein n=1 Tax=Haloechinothrix alba TaxID=664784 RepID=A0A238XEH5_9PSEU|nr:ABC transporter permease [Haloechinothrix alba]SNR57110.1 ABC-2 type transport system permease protein [Haloechinothrix alba]
MSATGPDTAGQGPVRIVALVARREITTRLRTKAFAFGTLAIVAGIAIYVLLINALFSDSETTAIGVSGQATHIASQLEASANELGLEADVTTLASAEQGRSQVDSGELDAAVSGAASDLEVVAESELDERLHAALTGITQQQVLRAALAQAGVDDPDAVLGEANAAELDVTTLEPADPEEGQRLAVGAIMAFLLFFGISTYGAYVAQGVVEEKSSRVVEILLAAVRPWQLLLGKVAGLGLVGLIQLVIIAGLGLVMATASGVLTVSDVAYATFAWGVVWYVLGFFLYASVFAGAGSLVSRQEDMQSVVTPVTMILVLGFVVGINVTMADPGGTTAAVMSLVPFFAPMLMPGRIAASDVTGWEIALAAGLTVLMILVLTWLGGKIYRNAVLHMGSRLKLAEALRPSKV